MPRERMECFWLLFDHLAWIKHQFLSGISDSRKAGSLWVMMRGVWGVRKSIHQSWLAKGLLCWGFKRVREEIPWEEASTLQNAPVHNSILVTDYLTKMYIKTVRHLLYSPDFAPSDFCLFPTLRDNWGDERGCDEGHWHAHTRGLLCCLPEGLGTVQQFHCSQGRLLRRGLEFHVCTINKMPIRKKSRNIFNDPGIYIYIYIIYIYIYIYYQTP